MNKRILNGGLVLSASALTALLASSAVISQEADDAGATTGLFEPDPNWEHPTTSWGDPDLQGTWPIMHLISTQLQRNPRYGDRRYLNDEEYAAAQAGLERREQSYQNEIASNSMGMGHWAESTTRSDAARLTSLISFPEDGRFPALTEQGEAMRSDFGSSWSTQNSGAGFDSPQDDFDTWDRCITRGMPNSMLPFNYNNGIRIIQAPGYAIIDLEMIHESRIVPLDGRPPLSSEIKHWMGEPRGHWEGNTLVVETTNYNGKVGMTNVGTPGSPQGNTPSSTSMRTVERFTRVADDRIEYEMTIEDPVVLTSPWTISYPMFLDNEYQFFEYACHEDNTAVRNFIETSRYERANPEQFAPPPGRGGGAGGRGGRGGGRGGAQ